MSYLAYGYICRENLFAENSSLAIPSEKEGIVLAIGTYQANTSWIKDTLASIDDNYQKSYTVFSLTGNTPSSGDNIDTALSPYAIVSTTLEDYKKRLTKSLLSIFSLVNEFMTSNMLEDLVLYITEGYDDSWVGYQYSNDLVDILLKSINNYDFPSLRIAFTKAA